MQVVHTIDAVRRLGLFNVVSVAVYRILLRLGMHPVQKVQRTIGGREFFRPCAALENMPNPPNHWWEESLYFGWYREALGSTPPDWHRNPFNGKRVQNTYLQWWRLSDFATGLGDIKAIWEASRFDWVLAFSQRVRSGDTEALARLNAWLADWCEQNPAYRGPNWKCGQEASIRVVHLLLASKLLDQFDQAEPDLLVFIEAHLARIAPSLRYALAQDNNHGTSEAAAMFIGGAWCERQGLAQGRRWSELGRRWLENRVDRLITPDGSFSQHSVNYHRLMLDTLSWAELLRRDLGLAEFSSYFYARAAAATHWLSAMVEPLGGDAPNLGGNDGANLLPLTDADYRDYRPSLELASLCFAPHYCPQGNGPHKQVSQWLGLEAQGLLDAKVSTEKNSLFHADGYIIMRNEPWRVLFRYPNYRFRPSHCDQLHVDVWYGSLNVLRDAGSYSYNPEEDDKGLFAGTVGHNTIEFDGRDSMPKVSRFLRARWLEAVVHETEEIDETLRARAKYSDWQKAQHEREVNLSCDGLTVVDRIRGFKKQAVMRWRLCPDEERNIWRLREDGAENVAFRIRVTPSDSIVSIRLVQGWESRYYCKKTPVPVLEVVCTLNQKMEITTVISQSTQ
ncbi:MAG: heparinase II/III-family protein [Paracoccaceae bacterium]